MKIVLTLIGSRDEKFFLAIAEKIKILGYKPFFISFYEPSCANLVNLGYEVLNVHYQKKFLNLNFLTNEYKNQYEIQNKTLLNKIILHEKLTYHIKDSDYLIKKTLIYDKIISDWVKKNSPDVVMQELGGFIAPLVLYYSCKRINVKHIFIEPMLYNNTLGFVEDSLNYNIDMNLENLRHFNAVDNYIKLYINDQILIKPKKDAHHFTGGSLWGIVNITNLKKIQTKIYNKYIKKMGQEYDKIFIYTINKFISFINASINKIFYHYPNYSLNSEFYYYPFHVPLDIQLTVRSPKWLNQIHLVYQIASELPKGAELWIKEHPACVGSYSLLKLFPLLIKKNIKLIHPKINSFGLIKNSKAIITINSKVGLEAIMQNKLVFVFGDTSYAKDGISIKVDSVNELISYISNVNDLYKFIDFEKRMLFLCSLYEHSYPGELYDNSIENIDIFLAGFLRALNKKLKLKYEV